jgi:hypothetical protein
MGDVGHVKREAVVVDDIDVGAFAHGNLTAIGQAI